MAPFRALPPPPPLAPPATDTAPRTFAVSRLFLGDTARDGTQSVIAWKRFGYNLDGKTTTRDSHDVCLPAQGAGTYPQVDGEDGIDNACGSMVVPILQTFASDPSRRVTATVDAGSYSILLEIRGLTDDPQQSNTDVSGQIFQAGPLGTTPTFTSEDHWPVVASSLATGEIGGGARSAFPNAYINQGTWVSAPRGDLLLHIDLGSDNGVGTLGRFDFVIHQVVVTFVHASPHELSNGVIAGVVATNDFVAAAIDGVRLFSPRTFCSESAAGAIGQQVQQASDILSDGSNRPDVPCDAISVGFGFEAEEVANASRVLAAVKTATVPCWDAGWPANDAAAE